MLGGRPVTSDGICRQRRIVRAVVAAGVTAALACVVLTNAGGQERTKKPGGAKAPHPVSLADQKLLEEIRKLRLENDRPAKLTEAKLREEVRNLQLQNHKLGSFVEQAATYAATITAVLAI